MRHNSTPPSCRKRCDAGKQNQIGFQKSYYQYISILHCHKEPIDLENSCFKHPQILGSFLPSRLASQPGVSWQEQAEIAVIFAIVNYEQSSRLQNFGVECRSSRSIPFETVTWRIQACLGYSSSQTLISDFSNFTPNRTYQPHQMK